MKLDSYLEIFTTLYGWAFANIIGEIIVGTGLVVVPFMLLVFNAWHEAKDRGTDSSGAMALLDQISTRLIVSLFVMSVCFSTSSVTSLSHLNLTFTPPISAIDPNPKTGSSQSGTGSGYDQAMADVKDGSMSSAPNLSNVPAWWYTVMAISSGLNSAVRGGLSNAASEMRVVEETARTATISDPKLLGDVQRFYSECFVPVRSKYLSADPTALSANGQAIVATSNTNYGPADVDWMGSQLFRTEPGYYPDARSFNPVPGFAIDYSRDVDYYDPNAPTDLPPPDTTVNPEWGRPTCSQWWEDGGQGLRARMVNHSGTWQELLSRAGNVFSSLNEDQKLDAVARLAATKTNPQYVDPSGMLSKDYDGLTSFTRNMGGALGSVGLFFTTLFTSVSFVPLITGLFMMQSLILMGMYMFLPLITFLSGFDLKVMFTGAVAIFTVKFWAVMWAIATWVDSHLMEAMYPSIVNWSQVAEIFTTGDAAVLNNGYKRALLNILLMGMLVGLPSLWTGMMAWIGIRVGENLDRLSNNADSTAKSTAKNTPGAGKIKS